ncbi:ActS/PrrB/RegB family redox-sensitive histidine kinase [Parvibaculum sp.]|uniref:ActS/PrrB/RegB family redox-sensitive histidine kinase n=1 Tax=Parvibaculum sp. TaxID=2024848 RepID=UPI0025F1801B|nr:ActS/PrrB/RegB family redox-sensitive histidine kinase [Parvibaculum sp.]
MAVFEEDHGSMRWVRRRLLSPELRLGTVESGRVRLQTLVLLRWLAIAGQLVAVLLVNLGLGFPLPLGLCLMAIAASAGLNVFLTLRYRTTVRLPDWQAAVYFAIDLAQLAVLLFLTGGLQNPFALLFMAPVTISATTLSLRSTVALLVLSLVYVTSLAFFHMPLPWRPGLTFVVPDLYLVGNWAAISLGLGFMAAYAWRISQESKRMSAALSATQFVLARAQRLSALDGLAAAAAHELGTPLGTIALVAKELQRGGLSEQEMKDDLDLLASQAERCKEILGRLSREPKGEDALYSRLPLHVLLDEVVNPHRDLDVHFRVSIVAGEPDVHEPEIWRRPEILYGLGNFIENAADFARSEVSLTVVYDSRRIALSIVDDGPGFAPEVIEKLGEPYVTTRPRAGRPLEPDGEHEGMGLGFFIAKTLLERTKARVEIANRDDGKAGALVTVVWPREAIEAESPFPLKA